MSDAASQSDAPYTLVLLRHGQSDWNEKNLFTGWVDVGLTEQGAAEAHRGGELLAERGIRPDVVHTSVLRRAIRTAEIALDVADLLWLPVRRSWRLNERHYGALTGLNKKETGQKYGDAQLHQWRRGYAVLPPPLDEGDPRHPRFDPRYAKLPPELLPRTESLETVVARTLPYWYDAIVPRL
ncbi:MAG: 2,3-bisphosphoglycerate-dependent phosphoglycerate mutase, partial [Actinomycetes bacterium]